MIIICVMTAADAGVWAAADTGEVWERAKSLQEKMQANLQMAKDRLEVLGIISFLIVYLFISLKFAQFPIRSEIFIT